MADLGAWSPSMAWMEYVPLGIATVPSAVYPAMLLVFMRLSEVRTAFEVSEPAAVPVVAAVAGPAEGDPVTASTGAVSTAQPATLHYADPLTADPPRRRSRLATAGAIWCLGSPLVSFLLLIAAQGDALPQHFLCCRYPEVSVAVFIIAPAIGSLIGATASTRIARSGGRLTGWFAAAFASGTGTLLAFVGFGLYNLVRM